MRALSAAIAMLMLSGAAAAQPSAPVAGSVPPLPPIGLPLPQIGLPHPPTGLPVVGSQPTRNGGYAAAPGRRKPHGSVLPVVYFLPVYGWPYVAADAKPTDADERAPRAASPGLAGRLRLDISPEGDHQVYVDGYYVGTPADAGGGLELEAGAHTLEISAPGYETLRVPISVASGRSITYRGVLTASVPPSPPPAAPAAAAPGPAPAGPAAPMTYYIIRGCYLGNVPPKDAGLPPGCDPDRAIAVTPDR
jgi:hypothetical protein